MCILDVFFSCWISILSSQCCCPEDGKQIVPIGRQLLSCSALALALALALAALSPCHFCEIWLAISSKVAVQHFLAPQKVTSSVVGMKGNGLS